MTSLSELTITRTPSRRIHITDRRAVRIAALTARGLTEREATITVDLADAEVDEWQDDPRESTCSGCGQPCPTGTVCAACLDDDRLWRVPMEGR